jgi:hypothetical protein
MCLESQANLAKGCYKLQRETVRLIDIRPKSSVTQNYEPVRPPGVSTPCAAEVPPNVGTGAENVVT